MSEATQDRMKPVTIVLIVVASITSLLAIALAVAYLSRPKPITLSVTGPAGRVIVCDLVIDGRPESRRDAAPVTYVLEAKQVQFAVIPDTADSGNVRVEISAGGGKGSAGGAGIRGTASVGTVGGGVSIGNMSAQHVENMRASSATAAETSEDTQIDEAHPQQNPAALPSTR